MKKVLFSVLSLLTLFQFCAVKTQAQATINPIIWSSFTGTSASGSSTFGSLPASVTPGSTVVNISQWDRAGSLVNTTSGSTYNSSNWEQGGSLTTAQANSSYIYFTVSTDANTELSIDSVVLQSQVSATGPANVQLMYNTGASDVAFGAAITVTTFGSAIVLRFIPTAPLHLCASSAATFKLYGWGASTAAGTLRINNSSLVGARFVNKVQTAPVATPNPACSGQNVTLRGTPTAGAATTGGNYASYAWAGPGGFTSALRNRTIPNIPTTASGVYTFTVTDYFGCTATDTVTLTVNPTPTAPVATPSGTVTICSFDSVVLTAPSGYASYQWDTGAYATPYVIPGATNITYTARQSRRYRVQVTNSFGCSPLGPPATTIIVNPAASGAVTPSGSLSFCTGGSVTLTSTATGTGLTYQWYDSAATAASATPLTGETGASFTATTGGTYFVRIANSTGCITQSASFIVVEVTLPVISTSDTLAFCQGGSARLTVSIVSGATGVQFQWKKNTINIPGATSTTYIATSTGDYTCFVNIPGSCTITTNMIHVEVHPTPTPLVTFNGAKFTTYNYYRSYQWYLNTVTIPGATTRMVTATSNGSYRVLVTDTFGCIKLSDGYALNNLAVNSIETAAPISIYPNPATSMVHVEGAADARVTVSGMEGKVVLEYNKQNDINISTLPAGLYMIMVYDQKGNRLHVEKLIKQ
ncbi:MAG: T9SS type A sorting domain-containing protein [Taibaiella sp.]|nr:T9SS type A sorting domain-containing protein [Taibaiella sp.]